ncbi:hypothetical protein O3M35_007443 [Rhynocoris fuscipes]|uniref:TELO2-interacting protein 1 homolog n=1 Tax=Rhynocoris fuscipes TaxID=488301 RepID=A0AAW1DF59_9HEMI
MNKLLNLTEEERTAIEQTFSRLKPVCDRIALSPTKINADELKSVLVNLSPERLQLFDHYILVPIFMHLSTNRSSNSSINVALMECLHAVLERTKVSDINLFLKIYLLIFRQILDEKQPDKLSSSCEEMKLIVVKCVTTLIKNSEMSMLQDFYTRQYYGKLSMGVYACTRIAANEKNINLKEEALKALIYMIQVHDDNDISPEFRRQMADIVMLMLPGIVSKSLAVATASDIQNHRIVLLAIRLWSRAVGLVMEDNLTVNNRNNQLVFSLEKKTSNVNDITVDWSGNQAKTKETIQKMTRNREWIENSNKQLLPVTKAFVGLHCHQNWKVRLELVKAANHILNVAAKNMYSSVPHLIELLIILSQDEQKEVNLASKECIKSFSEYCNDGVKSLVEIVEESMYELITKLPRILHGVDLTLKEKQLCLVSGYLDILGKTHVPALLRSSQHLHRLFNSLFIAATLDFSSVSLLEESSLRGLDDQYSGCEKIWRKYKFCNTSKSQQLIEQICKKLVKYSELSLIAHLLLDKFSSEVTFRKEITLIYYYIFNSGYACNESETETALNVFNSLMDQNLWCLPVSPNVDEDISKEEAQSNVMQICLLSETISSLASFIGADLFAPLLLQCLYPLLECAGSPLFAISMAGLKSVRTIAELYGGGVSSLVARNVDYLSHHVTLNLRHAHRNPRVLAVLAVIMKHSTFTVLPSLHEIINDVLVQSCDTFQEINAGAFIQVFHTFILCLRNWCADECASIEEETVCDKDLFGKLLDYQKTKLESEKLEDNGEQIEDISEEEITSNIDKAKDENKIVPNHIKLTVEVVKRSLNFLPSKNQSRQILVLEILENGVILLRKWTDELLPIVHKIWSPLVKRFHNCDNHLILNRAFSLLKTLGKLSRDFIRVRTIKEVLPSLCSTLKLTAKDSLKCEKDAYKLSQKFKLQLSLLKGIGEIILDIEFSEKEVDSILVAITPYLSDRQPQQLQEACILSFTLIAKEFPDLVWLHLTSICPKQLIFEPPDASFPLYQFQDKSKEMKEYRKNVYHLIDVI